MINKPSYKVFIDSEFREAVEWTWNVFANYSSFISLIISNNSQSWVILFDHKSFFNVVTRDYASRSIRCKDYANIHQNLIMYSRNIHST